MKIIAIVPAYNCQKSIKKVINDLNNHFIDKILVIDDGSRDQTAELARQTGTEVISHRRNLGLGHALRTGFGEALRQKFGVVLTFDGDGQHLARDIKKVKREFEKNPQVDIVIGTRLQNRSHWHKFPRHRLWGNLILTFITNWAAGRSVITDSQSGYRAIRAEAIKKMELTSSRMAIASEIILEAAMKNLKIIEVPIIPTYGDETSNVRLLTDTMTIVGMLIKKRWRRTGKALDFVGSNRKVVKLKRQAE